MLEQLFRPSQRLITEGDHKYGCLMAMFATAFAKEVQNWAKQTIDPKDISPQDGIEDETHVTVLYGFDEATTPTELYDFLSGKPIFPISLGEISLFENDQDVLKIEVISPQLTELHYQLVDHFDVEETHPDYKPHITIAYLNQGTGKKYIGDHFQDRRFNINKLTYSSPAKERSQYYLG